MRQLENRIPPPVILLLTGLYMWGVSGWGVALFLPDALRWALLAVLALFALGFLLSSAWHFRQAGTTVNPLQPQKASQLVVQGAYTVTRNPMYLGMLLLLLGWALFLNSMPALSGPVLFWGFIARFQILPEERALLARFGEAYRQYCQQVRRWL